MAARSGWMCETVPEASNFFLQDKQQPVDVTRTIFAKKIALVTWS